MLESTRAFADSYDDMNFTPPYLSTIQAHTLILQGDRNALYPVEISVELAKAILGSSLWIMPNSGNAATRMPNRYQVGNNAVAGCVRRVRLRILSAEPKESSGTDRTIEGILLHLAVKLVTAVIVDRLVPVRGLRTLERISNHRVRTLHLRQGVKAILPAIQDHCRRRSP